MGDTQPVHPADRDATMQSPEEPMREHSRDAAPDVQPTQEGQ